MNIKKSYDKAFNKFKEDIIYNEYCTKFGNFPDTDIYELYITSGQSNNINPKQYLSIVKNTILDCLDGDNINIFSDIMSNLLDCTNNSNSTLQLYFDNIKDIYSNIGNVDNIEHTEENRDIILSKLLKLVIYIAKRYQGMNVPLEDLISAGNVGLCVAWDKFNPDKVPPKDKYIDIINNYDIELLSPDCVEDILKDVLQYGKIRESFLDYFDEYRLYTKQECISWINKNIKKAKFSSVAAMWIRAYVMQELNNNSRVVKKPKSEIDKDRILNNGVHIKENLVSIDHNDDDDINQNIINSKDMWVEDKDICNENQTIINNHLLKMMDGISQRDKIILMKMYGIGYPKTQTPREIALESGLTLARVSQISISAIEKMKNNSTEEDYKILIELLNG